MSVAGAGLCLLGLPLLRSAAVRPPPARPVPARPRRPPGSPSDAARRAAWYCWVQAELAVNEQRYALEAWDPAAGAITQSEEWRRQQMAADATGQLRRAWTWGRQAAALARTPEEEGAVAELLTVLAYETGRRQEELHQARRLIRLAPHDPIARLYWQKAVSDAEAVAGSR